jgi:phage terminase small subunit
MATAKKSTGRSRARSTQPVEEDGDDLLPVEGSALPPSKSPKKPKNKRTPRRSLPTEDQVADDIDSGEGGAAPVLEMEGIPQHNRRTMELEAQMQARLKGEPVFPYPPELAANLKPYWLELVNSFPSDHFQVSDITSMKMYCQCAYDIERQNLMIEEEGEVVMGARGPMVNPRCKVRDNNRATLMALTTKFRNQPASRTNTGNFKNRQEKAGVAAKAAETAHREHEEGDGLLAMPVSGARH